MPIPLFEKEGLGEIVQIKPLIPLYAPQVLFQWGKLMFEATDY
jgi:hypothetical protein